MPTRPKSARSRRGEAAAVVGNDDAQLSLLSSPGGEPDVRGLAVPDGVAHSFLQNAERRFLDTRRKAFVLDVGRERDRGPSGAPEGDQLLDRVRQSLIDQHRGTEPAQNAAQMQLHVLNGLADSLAAADGVIIGVARQQERDRLRIDVDSEKKRADLVVQIARDFGALFFLHRRQLLVEPLVLLLGGGLSCSAMRLKVR